MAEEKRQPDSSPLTEPARLEHPQVRFEPTDASFGSIVAIIVGAIVLGGCIQLGVLGFFNSLRHGAEKGTGNPFAAGLPPEPRLEQIDRLARVDTGSVKLEHMQARLSRYGPAKEQGTVHIPIERAMDYLADRLPVRATPPTPAQKKRQNGLVNAGESNSGRMFREGPHE